MMDEIAIRKRRALVQALEQPLFDQAIEDLRRRLADEIADCMDPTKAEVLRALLDRRADVYDVSAPELPTTFRSR